MVPVVLTELLSDPKLPSNVAKTLSDVPLIDIASDYWQRAGRLRAKVLASSLCSGQGGNVAICEPEVQIGTSGLMHNLSGNTGQRKR